jgi:C-terminal processing protease CtpA/Prc
MSGEHPFMPRMVANALVATTIETHALPGGIVYVNVPNFEHAAVAEDFGALVDRLGDDTTGLIIDVRHNLGGSDRLVKSMVSRLIDEPVSTPVMKFRHFVGADVAWGNPTEWETAHGVIEPHAGERWLGPLVVLTGGLTASSSEDLAIELRAAGRATLVGQTTAGSAGNGLRSELPGGGTLYVATFTALVPGSGEEYVGVGVTPDVQVRPTPDDLAAGRDVVLERAIELLER